jgi:hypothetical protein
VILPRPSACLLLLVSWLLVAFIPGLLMLATFGLGRLEAGLDDDTVSPGDVAAFLEQAKADCAKPAARTSEEETYPLVDDDYVPGYRGRIVGDSARDLPVRALTHHESNPEFQPTRHAFRV